MNILNRGYWVTTILSAIALAFTTNMMMQTTEPGAVRRPGLAVLLRGGRGRPRRPASPSSTSPSTTRPAAYRPVREIAEASRTGPATNIISGTAVGFETTFVTAITIGIALFASHWFGSQAGITQRSPATTSAASSGPRSRRWACS